MHKRIIQLVAHLDEYIKNSAAIGMFAFYLPLSFFLTRFKRGTHWNIFLEWYYGFAHFDPLHFPSERTANVTGNQRDFTATQYLEDAIKFW